MATNSTILTLLKFYATHANSAAVDYTEFCSYVKKYAQHHVEEQPELVSYLGGSDAIIEKELEALALAHNVVIAELPNKKQGLYVVSMYVQKFQKRYEEMYSKPEIPFPVLSDLPKQTPKEIAEQIACGDFLTANIKKKDGEHEKLFCLTLPHNIPAVVFPSTIPAEKLFLASHQKICAMLSKDQYHEYFAKKITMSNPGRELAAKNFFEAFVQSSERALAAVKDSGDVSYFCSQLCYFISQDYNNIQEFTSADQNILQAVNIMQCFIAFYKAEQQKNAQKTAALEALKQNLLKQPFYYSMDSVMSFTDSNGNLICKQLANEDLKEFLSAETTNAANNELPNLLVFKVASGKRYFIYKHRVFQLIIRLCSEAHETIGKTLEDKWFAAMMLFEKTPDMQDQVEFEKVLEQAVETASPVLYALLNANFLSMLAYEMHNAEGSQHLNLIFANNELLPYSQLLMLKRQTLFNNARIKLPFWYTFPGISWFFSLFKKKKKKEKERPRAATGFMQVTEEEVPRTGEKKVSRKDGLVSAAKVLEKRYVQEGSTLEREMVSYNAIWNKMIDKTANANLREDVDSLIRDYVRQLLRTLNGSTFTEERVQNLASTLCNTPSMRKIGEHDALLMYTKLYIVYLIKNMR